jgi:hypothetical protein
VALPITGVLRRPPESPDSETRGPSEMMSPMHQQPQGAAFDVVLLLHVGCVVVGFVTTVTAGATAARLRRLVGAGSALPEALRRYFRPGVNWAGRTVYGIPVFGFALVGMSQGAYAVTDGWVLAGLILFIALALVAEAALWPAERRVQAALGIACGHGGPSSDAADVVAGAATMARAAGLVLVLLTAGTVVMIAQPAL